MNTAPPVVRLFVCVALAVAATAQEAQSRPSSAASRPAAAEAGLTARFANDAKTTGWIPIDLELDAYVYLRGRVNGVETDIVLDSGAGGTVIDQALAARLGVAKVGDVMAKGVGGRQNAAFLAPVRIEIGALTLEIPRPVAIDMSGVGKLLGRPMPVILGKQAFEALVVDLDYPRSRVALIAADSFHYAGPGRTVAFAQKDGQPMVELEIEDFGAAKFHFDTGSGATLDVFDRFTKEHDVLDGRAPVSTREAGGVGGTIVSKCATLKSVKFAGYELRDVPAGFAPGGTGGAFDSATLAGNVGAGIFSRFRLIIDWGREEMHVEPGSGWNTRPFRKDRIGLGGVLDGEAIRITHVAAGSPAEKSGWAAGQKILAVNGKPVTAGSWRAALLAVTRAPAGSEVELLDASGRASKLRAADYY